MAQDQISAKDAFKQMLKFGACCLIPILLIAVALPLVGSAAAILAPLALLACPLGMLIMFWLMGRQNQQQQRLAPEEFVKRIETELAKDNGKGELLGEAEKLADKVRKERN